MNMKRWWKAWSELIQKLLALAGSVASLLGLLVLYLPPLRSLPWWAVAIFVIALLFLIWLVALECLNHKRHRVYAKSDTSGIKRYMHDWIEHGGRVAVWSRDMSWAQNFDTRNLLKEKAGRGELILCLPEESEFSNELATAGAEVCAYGSNYIESPASRFTIIYFGRDGARVAVGRAEGDNHIIEEFSAGRHPAFFLAEDLVALVRAQCASRRIK